MNLYSRKQRWKLVLALAALAIVGASLWYSSRIVDKVRQEERRKVELWAEAVRNRAQLVNYTDSLFHRLREEERKRVELWAEAQVHLASDNVNDLGFYLKVVSGNTTIPVIITDAQGKPITGRNLPPGMADHPDSMRAEVARMDARHGPIPITLLGAQRQYLHYTDSRILSDLERVMDNIIRSFISETVMNTAAVPVIYTDSTRTHVIEHSNIELTVMADSTLLQARIAAMSQANTPIEVSLAGRGRNYIFYEESRVITQLRYFPYVQFGIIGLFLLVSYALFSLFRNAEQNQVWVGMAKETAHQLGTPLSSLMAWTELLKERSADPATVAEMGKDVARLEVITERFSKIGSAPELVPEPIDAALRDTVQYLRPRLPSRVQVEVVTGESGLSVPLNKPLFSWVLENLVRNAVDAMQGEGRITITTEHDGSNVHIDVADSGKGIPASKLKTVFRPGYTTKKRGWGLGLSLTKRIIEQYHKGKIFVKRSAVGKGTTFRITLRG
jgi:signal transduction histidine kinase